MHWIWNACVLLTSVDSLKSLNLAVNFALWFLAYFCFIHWNNWLRGTPSFSYLLWWMYRQEVEQHGLVKVPSHIDENEVFNEIFTPSRGEIKHRRSPHVSSSSELIIYLLRYSAPLVYWQLKEILQIYPSLKLRQRDKKKAS